MKKQLPGIIAAALAVILNSFGSSPKTNSYTMLYRFVFVGSPTVSNITATCSESGIDYYTNWVFENTETNLTTCAPGEERACKVAVVENYTYDFSGETGIKLLAEDPDGWQLKLAFPMETELGLYIQYPYHFQSHIVSTGIKIEGVLDVRNGTYN